MNYNVNLNPEHIQVIRAALGELPYRISVNSVNHLEAEIRRVEFEAREKEIQSHQPAQTTETKTAE